MAIYGLVSGDDGKSQIVDLQIVGNGPALDSPLPCSGWRPFQCKPGHVQPAHPTPVIGMTVILAGCMEISVGDESTDPLSLQPGDSLLVLDTQGIGHSTTIAGPDDLQIMGVSFDKSQWAEIRSHFSGWPNTMLEP